jgi:hypothetical protein
MEIPVICKAYHHEANWKSYKDNVQELHQQAGEQGWQQNFIQKKKIFQMIFYALFVLTKNIVMNLDLMNVKLFWRCVMIWREYQDTPPAGGWNMNNAAMIDYTASEWVALGGDVDGFAFTQRKILERLREIELRQQAGG